MQSTITESGALFHAQRRARIVKVKRVIRVAERGGDRTNQWQRIRQRVAALFRR
jgi:hypothetical protein